MSILILCCVNENIVIILIVNFIGGYKICLFWICSEVDPPLWMSVLGCEYWNWLISDEELIGFRNSFVHNNIVWMF